MQRRLVRTVVVLMILCHQTVLASRNRCGDDGFILLGGNCFYFSQNLTDSYEEANGVCKNFKSDLATITDENIQQHLTRWIQGHGYRYQSYMISLKYSFVEARFKWQTSEMSYQAWEEGYPQLNYGRHCVIISNRSKFAWRNTNCNTRNLYICQRAPSRPVHSPQVRQDDGNDDTEVLSLGSVCAGKVTGYYPHPTLPTSYILCNMGRMRAFRCEEGNIYDSVSRRCVSATVSTSVQTTDVVALVQTPSRPINEELMLHADGSNQELIDENVVCKNDYVMFSSRICYKVYRDIKKWNDAEKFCASQDNATLAHVPSKSANDFLLNLWYTHSSAMGGGKSFWIGANDHETPSTFVWPDGSTLDSYNNWSKLANKRQGHFRDCVLVSATYGKKWIDEVCSRRFGFICEKSPEVRTAPLKPAPTKCRRNQPLTSEVIGGHTAVSSEYSWHVSLRNSTNHHICGGTLIENCWVMTAAHCLSEIQHRSSRIKVTHVTIGDFVLDTPEKSQRRLAISQSIVHPQYVDSTDGANRPVNDISLIRLRECLSDGEVSPVCLNLGEEIAAGEMCKVAGFGTTDKDYMKYTNLLKEASVPLMSQDDCDKAFSEKTGRKVISPSMICAGFEEGGADSCTGDSGGPLTCPGASDAEQPVQVGVVSWGIGCAEKGLPGVYTRVKSFATWLRAVTNVDF